MVVDASVIEGPDHDVVDDTTGKVLKYRYKPNDSTHQQIDRRAFHLVQRHGLAIEPGKNKDKSPRFRGLTNLFWQKLYDTNRRDFYRLVAIIRSDFPTYCALMLRIVSRLDMTTHAFIFNNPQRIVWNKMAWCMLNARMIYLVILKARQQGITTIVVGWNHFQLFIGENVRTLDTTHDEALAHRVISFFRVFHENLPTVKDANGNTLSLLKPKLRSDSKNAKIPKKELYYADRMNHGDTYVAKNLDPRGFTTPFIGEHECAFYPDLYAFNDALLPQLPALGSEARKKCSVFLESTPNGQNDFYEVWNEAKDPEHEAIGVFLPWFVHEDEYSLAPPDSWKMSEEYAEEQRHLSHERMRIEGKRVTKAQMYWMYLTIKGKGGSREAFDMEYPSDDETCFQNKSSALFADDMRFLTQSCRNMEMEAEKAWKTKSDSSGSAIVTHGGVTGELRFPALHSPFTSVNYLKLEKPRFAMGPGDVTIWVPPVSGHAYAAGIDVAGGEFMRDKSVMSILDVTTGDQVGQISGYIRPEKFADLCVHAAVWYNRCLLMPEINGLGSVLLKRMANDWGYTNIAKEERWDETGVKKNKPGWNTSPQNRPHIFSTLKYFIEERYLRVASRDFVREASTFEKDGETYRTKKKHMHDDFVVAMALACMAVRQTPKLMSMIGAARGQRIPSAVDLGLNHNVEAPTFARVHGADDELLTRLQGLSGVYDVPLNPLRGPMDIEW